METARAVRERRFTNIEWDAIAEELEDMGRSEARALESQLARLLAHLLKWRHQSEQRAHSEHSWRATITDAREEIQELLLKNPSLRPELSACFPKAYRKGRRWAIIETNLPEATFPAECPWSLQQALDEGFWQEN